MIKSLLKSRFSKQREAKELIEIRLEDAKQRKKQLQDESIMNKKLNGIVNFKKHWLLREEAQAKNVEVLELYEQEKRENMEVN